MIDAYTAWHNSSSWARHGRQFFEALGRHDLVRIRAYDSEPLGSSYFVIGAESPKPEKSTCRTAIGICPLNRLHEISGDRRIAFVAFESTHLQPETVRLLGSFDRVWVPSYWGRSILITNGIDESQIDVVPEGVDVEHFTPTSHTETWVSRVIGKIRKPRFRFLSVGKWEVRKNIDGLVIAFSKAFHPSDPVELVLHCSNQFTPFDYGARVELLTNGRHPSIVVSTPCSWDRMRNLYGSSDAFILPSRAEGWGLPIMEAMACGIPIIITKYSAPMDFTSAENAYYIDVESLVPISDPVFFGNDRGGVWAEPSLNHMVEILRYVYEHREEARHKGLVARQSVVDGWTWNDAAAKAIAILRKQGFM